MKQESDQRHCLVQTLDKSGKIYCFLPPHAAPLQSFQQNNALKTCFKTLKRTKFKESGLLSSMKICSASLNVLVFLDKNFEAHSKLMISFIIEVGRRNQIRANNYIVFWRIVCISYSCICICTGFVFCILSVYICISKFEICSLVL